MKLPENHIWESESGPRSLKPAQPIFRDSRTGEPYVSIRDEQNARLAAMAQQPPSYEADQKEISAPRKIAADNIAMSNMKVDGLRALCKERGLKPASGKRADLIAALEGQE